MKAIEPQSRRCLWASVLVIIAVLACTGVRAYAQRNNTSPIYSWAGMKNNFIHTNANGSQYWVQTVGGTTPNSFWTQAEMLEMAVDAYSWAKTYDTGNLTNYKNQILNLANGFRGLHGDDWSSNPWNDDLDVAVIAFIRGYIATGSAIMLSDAENNFNTVWSRAQEGNGGLCERTVVPVNCYENSSVNWTFVIAGRTIYDYNGHTGNYQSEANSVYTWAKANLYQTSGYVCDGPACSSTYSYNFGYAIGAGSAESDTTLVANASSYLMNNLGGYNGTYNGYNILPNYGQGANDNDGGFNGIVMRWIDVANGRGQISSTVMAWAKANIDDAWANRDGQELMWDDWNHPTPATGGGSAVYSWDCSSAAVGMFDIPIS